MKSPKFLSTPASAQILLKRKYSSWEQWYNKTYRHRLTPSHGLYNEFVDGQFLQSCKPEQKDKFKPSVQHKTLSFMNRDIQKQKQTSKAQHC